MHSKIPFWEKPLEELDAGQWEALCDGCGRCCLHKAEDADTGHIYGTNIACRLLDCTSGRCGDYANRKARVPDCTLLTPDNLDRFTWLPDSCAYRLRAAGHPLPEWHYLVCGDHEAVHRAGASVRGWVVSEDEAGAIEDHLAPDPL